MCVHPTNSLLPFATFQTPLFVVPHLFLPCREQAGEVVSVCVHPTNSLLPFATFQTPLFVVPHLFLPCREQAGEVVSVCVHPTNSYLITAAGDGSWAFYDVAAAACVTQVCRSFICWFLS